MADPQLTGRRAQRQAAIAAAQAVLENIADDDQSPTAVALREMVAATTPRPKVSAPRVILDKADPQAVREYFDSLGLPRKVIAQAAGVGTSTIATVQNPKGDAWSVETFEAKQQAIAAWIEAHDAEVTAIRTEAANALAARQQRASAKAARAAARAQQAATPAPAPKPAAKATKAQPKGKVTVASRRRQSQQAAVSAP